MSLKYISTRGGKELNSIEAIVKGISENGGLYIPTEIPRIDKEIYELKDYDYRELAKYIIGKFFPDFTEEELKNCVEGAYDSKFNDEKIVPIVSKDNANFLELYHGATLAFKDMALSILPYFITTSLKKLNQKEKLVILTATSGDTGKAALEGFKDVEGTEIIVFYPESGVSQIQERQMITQEGNNTHVVGIEGNFDDAQNGVKEAFNNESFKKELKEKGYLLSSANSINIGRLVPQVVYYVYGYINLLKEGRIQEGEKINIVVPTGNFGNILAGYYAKLMGIPIDKLITASNENNVLYDFFSTGIYDRNRELKLTISPSMDILISSNLERLLYKICGDNPNKVKELMGELSEKGRYEIDSEIRENLNDFYGNFSTEEEIEYTIKEVYEKYDYVIDTHTAVAYNVYQKYLKDTGDDKKTLIASTASPFKFTRSVAKALGINVEGKTDFELVYELSDKTGLEIPKNIYKIEDKKIIHKNKCKKDEMKDIIRELLNE
ncbi:MAG: threonine synthase [Andreesenia angusta]|nr:threonine synthase [Andreesenia angusta]